MKPIAFSILVALCLAGPGRAQVVPTNGLIAYYTLNGNANDQSGNGNNGVVSGTLPTTDRFGNPGAATLFNSNSVVTIAPLSSNNLAEVTISAWVRLNGPTADVSTIVDKWRVYSYSLEDYTLGITTDLRATLENGRHGTGYYDLANHCFVTSSNQLAVGTWYQIVATLDSSGNGKIWLNGTLSAQDNILPLDPPASEPVRLGRALFTAGSPFNGGIANTFNGAIDDVRIYNRALAAGEVQQLYVAEAPCQSHRAAATPQLDNGFVVGANLTDGGCGYTNIPGVLIQGGGGTGATATAVVSNGVIVGITITDAGIGYTYAPTIYIYSPSAPQITLVRAVKPSFTDLFVGTNYQLQLSTNLVTWTNQGAPFTTTNTVMDYPQYFDVTNFNQLYFRLQIVP